MVSKRALMSSDYYADKLGSHERFGNGNDFGNFYNEKFRLLIVIVDYADYTKEAVKTFLDYLHLIRVDALELGLLLETQKFLHYEVITVDC